MHEILLIFTAVLFYFIGRFSTSPESLSSTVRKAKQIVSPVKPGPITYPTPKEIAYRGSVDEQINENAKKLVESLKAS